MAETTRKLGRYELRHRIAKGGMGEIYLAKMHGAAGFEKNVIIKTILPHLAEEEEFVTKFLDEGRIVVQLVHGNIVPVFDMGEEAGEYFIAMEYIPGRDLREVVKRLQVKGETMPIDLALYVASEVAKGLDYAQRKTDESGKSLGLVHRDISPSNVLISSEGEVKIIDFGIARAAGRLSKTVSGRIQGKFCYMSPEQASGKALDARSDIFSLGTTLYEMLTGFRPFEGQTDLESLDLVRTCEFDPPSTLNPEIGPEVDEILAKALARNQDERYPSAEKLQVDILQYLYSTGSSPTGSDVARFLSEVFPEGLERSELKKARGSGSNSEPMNLDDAFDVLLAEEGINPMETTAASGKNLEVSAKHTATLHAEVSKATPTTAQDSGANPAVGQATPTPISVSATLPPSEPEKQGRKRWLAASALVGVLIGATAMLWMFTRPDTGKVNLSSTPEGARIYVDDVLLVDKKTPAMLELEEGTHRIRLEVDGYEDGRLELSVRAGDTLQVDPSDVRLRAMLKPRKFLVKAPDGAVIFRDGKEVGTGSATIEVSPGGLATLEARKEGCEGQIYPIAYEHVSDTATLPLSCRERPSEPDAGQPAEVVETPAEDADPARTVRFRVVTNPAGAALTINRKAAGTSPAVASFAANQWVTIRAELDGYSPAETKRRAGQIRGALTMNLEALPMGCLTLSLGSPQLGEISIDGGPFEQVSRGFKARPIAAGKHTIRARNDVADKNETLNIDVSPGKSCRVIHIWPAH